MKNAFRKLGRGLAIAAPLAVLAAALLLSSSSPARGVPTEVGSGDRLAFAITGARVIAAPGKVFDPGVVVVRGGVIEAVGAEGSTSIPADARVFDRKGRTVHAAYLDPYVTADRLAGRRPRSPIDDEEAAEGAPTRGAGAAPAAAAPPSDPAHPEQRVVETLRVTERVAESFRRAGFAVVAAVPSSGVLRGRGAVLTLGEGPVESRILTSDDAQYATLEPERFDFGNFGRAAYPVSRMGAVALVRQTFADALWWRDAQAAYAKKPAGQRRLSWEAGRAALLGAAEGRETVVFEASDALSLLRAEKLARELKLKARFVTAGDEYRIRDLVLASKPDLIVRVDFPRPVRLDDDAEWQEVPLERLRRFDRSPSNPRWLRDAGAIFSLTTAGLEEVEDFPRRVREAMARGLSKDDALAAVTVVPARQLGFADRLGAIETGRLANLAVETGEPFGESTHMTEIWIDGRRIEIPERRGARPLSEMRYEADVRPLPAPEAGPLTAPKAVVIRHATVWTQGPAGVIEDGDLVAVNGRITAVGRALAAPQGALEIDGRGMHLTPGIVDCHSHTGVDGQVNEGTHAVSAEVRIQDVIDPFDVAIYRELAGGTTTANVLHGSANAIGGQNAIVKWRWGAAPDDYLLAGAPPGIKFALGENPKQSNFQNPRPRYPATRMGVANLIRERFLAARDYRKRQEEYRKAAGVKGATPIPPAPDLQLEAIAEILEGKRQIHCHSYRKDEILEMLRVAEEFGVKVATLQHVLEGYKVADEMAKHGAGGSTFSDWWAYKPEAYDAIPYNGALMRERGVVVSFNSDSDELARRLNWEAAKAVRYGGVPPADALAFVTSNPAKQLGIFQRVGSLEAGKDADFVLWSGDPLSTTSIALQTWVDGKKYFDRPADLAGRAALEKEKSDLIARAKKTLELERRRARSGDAEGTTAAPSSASEAAPPAGSQTAPPVRPAAPSRTPEEPERRPAPPVNVTPARPTPGPTPGAGR